MRHAAVTCSSLIASACIAVVLEFEKVLEVATAGPVSEAKHGVAPPGSTLTAHEVNWLSAQNRVLNVKYARFLTSVHTPSTQQLSFATSAAPTWLAFG